MPVGAPGVEPAPRIGELSGPIGVVPAETEGSEDVGRPDSGEMPGRAGALPMTAGLSGLVAPARVVLVLRSRTERLGIVGDVFGVPGVASAPMSLPPAEPTLRGLVLEELLVEEVEPAGGVLVVVAGPDELAVPPPDAPAVWPIACSTHARPQSAAIASKDFVFMAMIEKCRLSLAHDASPPPENGASLLANRPCEKTFVPAPESASVTGNCA